MPTALHGHNTFASFDSAISVHVHHGSEVSGAHAILARMVSLLFEQKLSKSSAAISNKSDQVLLFVSVLGNPCGFQHMVQAVVVKIDSGRC